jgi:hypothetical protein
MYVKMDEPHDNALVKHSGEEPTLIVLIKFIIA